MRTIVTHLLRGTVVAAVMALCSPTSGAAQAHAHAATPSAEVQAAAHTIEALFAAAEGGDLRALDTLYAGDSLLVIEGAGINRGWADYRDNHLGPELKQFTNFRYRPFEIEARVVGEVAWVTYRYALMAEIGERRIDAVGRGTAILEKRGSRWVVRLTQTASRARRDGDPPMPAAPGR